MKDFIQWGMQWHNQLRNTSLTSLATVVHIGGTLKVPATKVDPETIVNVNGVRVVSQHSLFIFNTRDIASITFNRGVQITFKDILYEVIIDRTSREEYDDTENLSTIITVKQC